MKFDLEKAKNGEPFTYDNREAKFGCLSPDGNKFSIWYHHPKGWFSVDFWSDGSCWNNLEMSPRKIEVKIWMSVMAEREYIFATTNDTEKAVERSDKLLKTIEVEI